jgi:hypothetical protein
VAAVRIGTAAAIGTTARLVRELRCARSSRPSEDAEETPTTEPEGQVNDFRHQDTAEDGSARQVVEVVAEELGRSLRWATATPVHATRSASEQSSTMHRRSGDGWSGTRRGGAACRCPVPPGMPSRWP